MRSSKWTLKNRFGVIEMLFEFNFFPVSKECIDKIVSLVKKMKKYINLKLLKI